MDHRTTRRGSGLAGGPDRAARWPGGVRGELSQPAERLEPGWGRPVRLHGGRAQLQRAGLRRRHLRLPERRHRGPVARRRDDQGVHPAIRPRGRGRRDHPHRRSRASPSTAPTTSSSAPTAGCTSPTRAPIDRPTRNPATSSASTRLARGHVVLAFETPVFPNGIAVEDDGSIVWDESYTGHVGRLRPDGTREDLGRLSGANPILDGMKIGADGRLYVTDITGAGIHVLQPDGTEERFIPVRQCRHQLRLRRHRPVHDRRGRARPTAPTRRSGAPCGASPSGSPGQPLHPGAIAGGAR